MIQEVVFRRMCCLLACCTVNDNGPTFRACDCFALSSDLNHMAFVIIVINKSDMQHEMRCALVKLLLVGLEKTENQRCSLESFLRTLAENSCLKATKSSSPATGRILSTIPSSSSKASHRSHRKIYLKKCTSITYQCPHIPPNKIILIAL